MGVFGQRLKECRTAQGLSQAALARALGMPRQQINNYEGGRFDPSLDTARKIADVLRVSLDTLTTPAAAAPEDEALSSAAPEAPRYTASVDLGHFLVDIEDVSAALATGEGEDYR